MGFVLELQDSPTAVLDDADRAEQSVWSSVSLALCFISLASVALCVTV